MEVGKGHGADAAPVRLQSILWFSLFACSSVSMVLLNKYCIMLVPHPYSVLGFQNSMTIILNLAGVQLGIFKIQPFKMAQFRMFFFPTFLFVGMLATSLIALPYVSIATTVIFRAISTCLVAMGDFLIFRRKFTTAEVVCMLFVVAGAFVYSAGDISFDRTGYMWMSINSIMFASSQLYEKYAVVSLEQTAVGISCVQNMMSLPIIMVMGLLMHESPISSLQNATMFTRISVFITGFCGCALSVCYMSLTKFASVTSISLAGNFNKLVSIVAGAFVFNNPLKLMQMVGLLISMTATMAFSQNGKLPFEFKPLLMHRRNQGYLLLMCLISYLSVTQLYSHTDILDKRRPFQSLLGWKRLGSFSVAERQQQKVADLVRQISEANEHIAQYSAELTKATSELAEITAQTPLAADAGDAELLLLNASSLDSTAAVAAPAMGNLTPNLSPLLDAESLRKSNDTLTATSTADTSIALANAEGLIRGSEKSATRSANRSELSV